MIINWFEKLKGQNFNVQNFIEGRYKACSGEIILDKLSPRDGSLLYRFNTGTGTEVDDAVASARVAFEDGRWAGLELSTRQAALNKLADLIEENAQELALYEAMDVGKPITNAFHGDIVTAAGTLRNVAQAAEQISQPSGSDGAYFAYHQRGPIGVVAGIVGWNFPLVLACQKIAPAMIMGNSIILKPSEFTSLSACRLAELAIEAGIPDGVFNVVNGSGAIVGDRLARHMDVDLLSFVGSTATGKQLMVSAGQSNMKRMILECGGKSPYLVFDDCPDDLDMIAADIVGKAFPNQGALCVASTRLLIQETIRDKLLPKIIELTQKITPSDPLDLETTFGALINQGHMGKVQGYVQSGIEQGAKLLCGGEQVNSETGGYYMTPAIFDQVKPDYKIAQEEIFGPLLSVLTFKDEVEAIKLANDSDFGLFSYVATRNIGRIHRLGKELQAGGLVVMGTSSPSGGEVPIFIEPYKQSGFGRSGGLEELMAYSAGTTVHLLHE
ncbi:aldehyde dehydrogenase family protein [Paremcibacter congregatus]|uniref:Aldehyde dehydrogenase PuuC n=1 Tax=Paremcibacter congregatus TaxID=2043170 RepID=A0A2G4YVK9_9PROT|nr:aldehyde dehydrogenase family protein [Paremcibacter congregatus]PHZ86368.1 aldehyde dehydrogenase PuuC [Paremcibacter congregatus]QDE27986.1 aldehyde dehydrogenase family protein [Paremcibacter congregatus]